MPQSKKKDTNSWLEAISKSTNLTVSSLTEFLALHQIQPSPTVASPRRMKIVNISFSGTKSEIANSGPFEFSWSPNKYGIWAALTDRNLKGKSSIIEVVRWLLRGKASSNFQEDVQKWIKRASLRFLLDHNEYEVEVDSLDYPNSISGKLKLHKSGNSSTIANFSFESEFEAIMSDFFMKQLDLNHITNWRKSGENDSGRSISHGWPALSGAMFIGTEYSSLLGDLGPNTGVPLRLMQMFIGLPWLSTMMSANTAKNRIDAELLARRRAKESILLTRQSRIEDIQNELDEQKLELSKTPSNKDTQTELETLSTKLSASRKSELQEEQKLHNGRSTLEDAEASLKDDQRLLRIHIDNEAAGAVFRTLEPSCCPRCDNLFEDRKKNLEADKNLCFVCGEEMETDSNGETRRKEIESRISQSKKAVKKARSFLESASQNLTKIKEERKTLEKDIDLKIEEQKSFDKRTSIEKKIIVLEARLSEAKFEQDEIDIDPLESDKLIIDRVIAETKNCMKITQSSILGQISIKILEFGQRFGIQNLSSAELNGSMHLRLKKGGINTSYSKVTAGEKLRLKVATILAMISVAEANNIGRHPAVLLIDSPRAQEVTDEDLTQLISGLKEITEEFKSLQIFVASLASQTILEQLPEEQRIHAKGEDALW